MNEVNVQINLDLLKPNSILPEFNAVQFDTKRTVTVSLYHNGVQYDLSDSAVRFYSKKGNGDISYLDAVLVGNKATVSLTNQTLALAGLLPCMMELRDNTVGVITTPVFSVNVLKSIVDANAVESSNEFTALTNALAEVENLEENYAPRLTAVEENKLDKDGDSKNNTVTFTEAATESDIVSGEEHSTLFGKILKSIKTLKSGKLNIANVVNNLTTTAAGNALDARQGKTLNDEVNAVKESLANKGSTTAITSGSGVSGSNLIAIPGTYLISGYDINITTSVVVSGVNYTFGMKLSGDVFAVGALTKSFISGGYANASYNQYCQWLYDTSGNLKVNAIYINGIAYTTSATTWVSARKSH